MCYNKLSTVICTGYTWCHTQFPNWIKYEIAITFECHAAPVPFFRTCFKLFQLRLVVFLQRNNHITLPGSKTLFVFLENRNNHSPFRCNSRVIQGQRNFGRISNIPGNTATKQLYMNKSCTLTENHNLQTPKNQFNCIKRLLSDSMITVASAYSLIVFVENSRPNNCQLCLWEQVTTAHC